MRVFPVPGRRIRDPKTMRLIPDAGIEVADTDPFWFRMLKAGDVATQPAPASAPAQTKTTAAPASVAASVKE